jgi:hypothetical protein
MQINNTLILKDSKFKALKHKELAKANIIAKPIKQLLLDMLLIFNRYIHQEKKTCQRFFA